MGNPAFWIMIGAALFLLVLFHSGARRLLLGALVVTLIVTAVYVFSRRIECTLPGGGRPSSNAPTVKTVAATSPSCQIELSPTWAGFCMPLSGAVIKQDGVYTLVGSPGAAAWCFDVRVWREQ